MCAISHCGNAKDAVIFKCIVLKNHKKATHQDIQLMWRRLRLIPNITANFTSYLNILKNKLLVNQWRFHQWSRSTRILSVGSAKLMLRLWDKYLPSECLTALLPRNYPHDQHSLLSKRSGTDLGVFKEIRFQKSCTEGNKQLRFTQYHLQRYRDHDSESFIKVQKSAPVHLVNDERTDETITVRIPPY